MLDDRIKSRILDDHKKLTADGKLYRGRNWKGSTGTFRYPVRPRRVGEARRRGTPRNDARPRQQGQPRLLA